MIQLLAPFLLTNLDQVPLDLLEKGVRLEANIFDCNILKNNFTWKLINKNLTYLQNNYGNVVKGLHFPVENANYLEDPNIKEILYRFIDICTNYQINTLVLHSNYIKEIESFDKNLINSTRQKFIDLYTEVDIFLNGKDVSIGVENMPIIGDRGVNFDSIFVFPEDFKNFNFRNIHITWDFGHWAYTCYVMETLNNFSTKLTVEKTRFDDYLKLKDQIIAAHFSSFKGTTYPYSNSFCNEGVPPADGDFSPKTLTSVIKKLKKRKEKMNLTLEIKEKDYSHRENIYKVISWIDKI